MKILFLSGVLLMASLTECAPFPSHSHFIADPVYTQLPVQQVPITYQQVNPPQYAYYDIFPRRIYHWNQLPQVETYNYFPSQTPVYDLRFPVQSIYSGLLPQYPVHIPQRPLVPTERPVFIREDGIETLDAKVDPELQKNYNVNKAQSESNEKYATHKSVNIQEDSVVVEAATK